LAIAWQPRSRLMARLILVRSCPGFGREMGAVRHRQVRADAVTCSQTMGVTSEDMSQQRTR